MLYAWFHISLDAITAGTLLIQFYLLWLVIYKTPKRMDSFKYSLIMLMQNELLLTIIIGIGLDPDLLLESGYQGAIINGLAKYFGPEGGRYAFALALFFGASVFSNQIYCLIFRYTAIQQNYPNLYAKFNSWKVRFYCAILQPIAPFFCGYLAFYCLADLAESKFLIEHPFFLNLIKESDIILSKNDTVRIMLSWGNGPKNFGIFVIGGYSVISMISIAFSVLIYCTINRNSSHFTTKTFRLHLQLTALLIIQFCLPAIFLVFPVCFAIVCAIFDLPIILVAGQPGILLLSLFTLANSLCTLLFIAPYREYTLRILRLKRATASTQHHQIEIKTTQITQHRMMDMGGADIPQIVVTKTN